MKQPLLVLLVVLLIMAGITALTERWSSYKMDQLTRVDPVTTVSMTPFGLGVSELKLGKDDVDVYFNFNAATPKGCTSMSTVALIRTDRTRDKPNVIIEQAQRSIVDFDASADGSVRLTAIRFKIPSASPAARYRIIRLTKYSCDGLRERGNVSTQQSNGFDIKK